MLTLISTTVTSILGLAMFFITPYQAFVLLCVTTAWYPSYAPIEIGPLNFTITRILILILFAKLVFHPHLLRTFRWNIVDTFLIVFTLAKVLALTTNAPLIRVIEREGGSFLDTVCIYFLARILITNKDILFHFMKTVIFASIPLAFIGLVDTFTGFNIFLKIFGSGTGVEIDDRSVRFGLYRTIGSFHQYILFGLYFAGLFLMCMCLWNNSNLRRGTMLFLLVCIGLGIFSSVSTGPLLALFSGLCFMAMFPIRKYWLVLIPTFVVFVSTLQVHITEPIYELSTNLALNKQTAEYRIGLIEEALGGGMQGHWIFGYGYVGKHSPQEGANLKFDWEHQDFVNIYIAVLARTGLLSLIPFLLFNIAYYRKLYIAYQLALPSYHWFIWSFAALLIGWNVASFSVSIFGDIEHFFYIFIGITSNMPFIMGLERYKAMNKIQQDL